jgi:transcriptional regulator with XRE-family HTH domain
MATKTLDSTVSDEVRAAMARRRVSQGELADHLEVSQAAISRRLSGEVAWSVPELISIALFLDVAAESLLSPASSTAATPPRDGGTPFPGDVPDPVAGDASSAA